MDLVAYGNKESERVITVSADVRSGYQSNAVLAQAQQVLSSYLNGLPPGYSYEWTGQQQEQDESFAFLGSFFDCGIFNILYFGLSV